MALFSLILLRLYIGGVFIFHGWGKVQRGEGFVGGMENFLKGNLDKSYDFYVPFVTEVVLPFKTVFAYMVAYGELALGVALVLGLVTRWAALGGCFLMLNFWFAKGIPVEQFLSAQQHDISLFFVFLFLAMSQAGHVLGMDATLRHRWALSR